MDKNFTEKEINPSLKKPNIFFPNKDMNLCHLTQTKCSFADKHGKCSAPDVALELGCI